MFNSYRRGCAAVLFSGLLGIACFAQNPVPQIVGPVKPTAVVPGSGAFTLTVYGANFASGSVVNWNGQPRSTSFVSAHEVQAQILASDVATPTAGYITVTNPAPGGGKSSTFAQLEVHSPTSTIVATNPANYYFGWYALLAADFNNDNILDGSVQGRKESTCDWAMATGRFVSARLPGGTTGYLSGWSTAISMATETST